MPKLQGHDGTGGVLSRRARSRVSLMVHRVLYVSPVGELGGAELSLLDLARSLDQRHFEPSVVCFRAGPLVEACERLGIPARVIPADSRFLRLSFRGRRRSSLLVGLLGLRTIGTVLRLASFIRSSGIALVHTNGTKAHLLGSLAAVLATKPVVWHVRDFLGSGFQERVLLRLAKACATKVLVNSNAVARSFAGLRQSKVLTVYNGVDAQRFYLGVDGAEIRQELGIGLDVPLVGMVGIMTPWKGQDVFLRALPTVRARFPGARFLLVGDEIYVTEGHGGYRAQLVRLADALGVPSQVLFMGYRDDVHRMMAALDVLVHASIEPEPFGRVLIEGMAAGRAVIASNAGGVPEIVIHGETGLLVPPGDATALAEAIIKLLENPPLRQMMGKRGRERVESEFSLEKHVETVSRIYQSILDG